MNSSLSIPKADNLCLKKIYQVYFRSSPRRISDIPFHFLEGDFWIDLQNPNSLNEFQKLFFGCRIKITGIF